MAAPRTAPKLRLFDWGPSPFCLKVRAVLEHKGVAYERVAVLGPSLLEWWRRSRVRKVPALDVDGTLHDDSTRIAHEIERLFPDPAIVPIDPVERGLCHALEDWADEALYFIGLYYQWIDAGGRPMVRRAFGATPVGLLARAFYQRRISAQVRGHGTSRKPADHVRADLRRELQALTDLLSDGRPHLLGRWPLLCDFAVNAQLVYLSRPPESAQVLAEFAPVTAYMARMKALRAGVAPEA